MGRRVRPAQPTWQLRTSVLGDLSLREACLTAVRANMGNVRFLSCGFRSSSCVQGACGPFVQRCGGFVPLPLHTAHAGRALDE